MPVGTGGRRRRRGGTGGGGGVPGEARTADGGREAAGGGRRAIAEAGAVGRRRRTRAAGVQEVCATRTHRGRGLPPSRGGWLPHGPLAAGAGPLRQSPAGGLGRG